MTKEEIKDFLDVNSEKDIIDFIFNLNSELIRTTKALQTAQIMLKNRVTKDRYNNIVKKYNKLLKDKEK
jgi:hypothetical protein